MGVFRESDAALARNSNHILQAAAELARQVNARLIGKGHTRCQGQLVAGHQVGFFVNLDTNAMAQAVGEKPAIARLIDDLAGGPVDVLALSAGPDGTQGCMIGLADDSQRP